MSGIRDRFLYGTLLLLGVLGLLWADQHFGVTAGFLALSLLFALVSWVEFRRMFGGRVAAFAWVGAGVIATGLIGEWAFNEGHFPGDLRVAFVTALGVSAPLLMLLLSFRTEPNRDRAVEIALGSFGVLYLAIPLMLFLRLRGQEGGEWWVMLTVLAIKANDIGGYLAGRYFGKHKLSRLSPNKTIEGSIGGLLLGTVAVIGVYAACLSESSTLPIGKLVALALGVGVAGQAGDLIESFFKRAFSVKDSGALVPAFGGTLDMIDSVLLGAPAVYLCRSLLEL
ncbi:MAG: phosphatidate cytidylyltransferase [Planctomycetota bacterium]